MYSLTHAFSNHQCEKHYAAKRYRKQQHQSNMQKYSHPTFKTKNPGFIHISHDAEIHDGLRLTYGFCSYNFLCWQGVKARSYTQVQENRVETNTPLMLCPGFCIKDLVDVTYYDQISAPYKRATCGTPYHFCCFIELCGQVAATAPHPALNNICCPCLRKYQIGLADAETFSTEMEKSYKAFKAKPSERAAPKVQVME